MKSQIARRGGARLALAGLLLAGAGTAAGRAADRIDAPLSQTPGDAGRGQRLFASREGGHCVLCHQGGDAGPAGNIGPPLAGVGARLDAGQLRQRIVDITQVNPEAVMPAFHRTRGLNRVTASRVGQPLLTAQQVEDLVAYLATLR